MSTQHKTMKLDDAEDMAPKYGMGDIGSARFLRKDLGAEGIGMANYRLNPGQRIGFGHRHADCEEIYVVLAGVGPLQDRGRASSRSARATSSTARRPSCARGRPAPTASS